MQLATKPCGTHQAGRCARSSPRGLAPYNDKPDPSLICSSLRNLHTRFTHYRLGLTAAPSCAGMGHYISHMQRTRLAGEELQRAPGRGESNTDAAVTHACHCGSPAPAVCAAAGAKPAGGARRPATVPRDEHGESVLRCTPRRLRPVLPLTGALGADRTLQGRCAQAPHGQRAAVAGDRSQAAARAERQAARAPVARLARARGPRSGPRPDGAEGAWPGTGGRRAQVRRSMRCQAERPSAAS